MRTSRRRIPRYPHARQDRPRSGGEIGDSAHVVFVTAYDEHAIAAFQNGAADHLLKPVEVPRLRETVAPAQTHRAAAGQRAGRPDGAGEIALLEQAKPAAHLKWIRASVGNVTRLVHTDDILFIQSDNKYTRIVCRGADAFVRTPISELRARAGPGAVLAGASRRNRQRPRHRPRGARRKRTTGAALPWPPRKDRRFAAVLPAVQAGLAAGCGGGYVALKAGQHPASNCPETRACSRAPAHDACTWIRAFGGHAAKTQQAFSEKCRLNRANRLIQPKVDFIAFS